MSHQGWISLTHLRSIPSSYALRQTFTPKKASQKFGAESKMVLRPTFTLYEINPLILWIQQTEYFLFASVAKKRAIAYLLHQICVLINRGVSYPHYPIYESQCIPLIIDLCTSQDLLNNNVVLLFVCCFILVNKKHKLNIIVTKIKFVQ